MDKLAEALVKQDARMAKQDDLRLEELEVMKATAANPREPRTVFTAKLDLDLPVLAENDEDAEDGPRPEKTRAPKIFFHKYFVWRTKCF